MHFDNEGKRMVFQPETEQEERCLSMLMTAVNDHPFDREGVGKLAPLWFTADIPEYDGLDHDLFYEASKSTELEVGERALVVDYRVL